MFREKPRLDMWIEVDREREREGECEKEMQREEPPSPRRSGRSGRIGFAVRLSVAELAGRLSLQTSDR